MPPGAESILGVDLVAFQPQVTNGPPLRRPLLKSRCKGLRQLADSIC
jgi:hypothetical protein